MRINTSRARALPVLLALGLGACQSFLDVNNNPNAPETATVDIRLPALEMTFLHSTYYGQTALWGSEWTQQWAFNATRRSYAQVQNYELLDTDAASSWNYFYSRPGYASYTMARDASGDPDVYYRGIAKLFNAWTMQIVTDLWGPAPYTEAFKPEIREPKYDTQQTIYNGIFANLDTAVTLLSSTSAVARRPTTNDLLFGGDVTKWAKLAHFLQARANLRLAYAKGEDKVARANKTLAALAGALASNADDADLTYTGGDSARNPNYTFQELRTVFVASDFFLQMLKSRNDPRLPILYTPIVYDSIKGSGASRKTFPAKPGTYVGHLAGSDVFQADSTVSLIGPVFSNENAPLNIVSFADQKFTEAEARLIVAGAAAADQPYRDAIRANMTKLGVSQAAITAYLATRPALASVSNPLQEIITEKYIANFLKPEPWNDWRRTGFPVVPLVPQAVIPTIPQRIRAPNSELSSNGSQLAATGIPTGLDGMTVKLWWAGGDNK
ncbi:MAG TPA: SusD/RagB family nutrient-binding outer membrane lipoprotein [Gemmatimonadaceae bacterium]|nr:SusD/RagB family nutrient-binding outer membrane lipoprotein [Gemmatimonadaceae bacterium]